MLAAAAHLPDAAVRLAPVIQRVLHLSLRHLPDAIVEPVPRPGVQVQRVKHDAPHVVLALTVRVVADADRLCALVAAQVLERLLDQLTPAVDAINDLQVPAVALNYLGEKREIVARLPLEAEGEQSPQRECGVPDPAVAIVPVALAAWRLRQ